MVLNDIDALFAGIANVVKSFGSSEAYSGRILTVRSKLIELVPVVRLHSHPAVIVFGGIAKETRAA